MITRPLHVIASDIKANWTKVNYAAVPYLQAMASLQSASDSYGSDDAKSIILYFLNNAGSWRGDAARRIKAELKALV